MARHRSREAETEDVNQRRLRRGAVKRQHIDRWAVGSSQIAPGVIGPNHIRPTVIERIIERGAGTGVGQLLVVSAAGQSFADGGDYVNADAIEYQLGFEGVIAAGDSIVWPTDAVGVIQVEFKWASFEDGGTIEIEVDGVVPAWGTLAVGTVGQEGRGSRLVHINEGAAVKVKVTQSSGSAQLGDVTVEFAIPDPTITQPGNPTYEGVVLADGPVAYWRLGEAAGTAAADLTGNGHTGTYTGTYTLGAAGVMDDGSGDDALDLTAVASSGVLGSDWADLEFAGLLPYSVECWFQADSLASGSRVLVQKQVTGSGAGWELVAIGGATPSVAATRGSGGGASVDSGAGTISVGVPYHVVVTFDGTTVLLFLNGVEVDSDAGATSMGANSVAVSIGYDSADGLAGFDGRIDEVAIYDRALTLAEIIEHYVVGGGL